MLFKWKIEALWGDSNRSNWTLSPYGIFFVKFFETFYMVTLMKKSIWEVRNALMYSVYNERCCISRSLTYGQAADGAVTCLNIKKYLTKLGVKVMDNDRDKERTLRRRPQESIKALCAFAFIPVLYLGRYPLL